MSATPNNFRGRGGSGAPRGRGGRGGEDRAVYRDPAWRVESQAEERVPQAAGALPQQAVEHVRGGRGGQRGGARQQQPAKANEVLRHEETSRPKEDERSLVHAQAQAAAHPHPPPDFLSSERFSQLAYIHPNTKRAIVENFKYDQLSKVQAAAMPLAVQGKDVLAKARTGTGKTLAFLIPTVERLMKMPPEPKAIGALVLSPTRELAMQIYEECRMLTHFQRIKSQVVYGGTNIRTDQRNLQGVVDILIATPGRLIDHLDNTDGFAGRVEQLAILILDEADQMLEMGFRPSITKILTYLPEPRDGRQTLLFSATIPKELVQIAPQILGSRFEFVDAVAAQTVAPTTMTALPTAATAQAPAKNGAPRAGGDAAPAVLQADNPFATAAQVTQDFVVTSLDAQMAAVFSLLDAERKLNPATHKIIVFFTTARLTQLYAELFNAIGIPTLEIHSRQSQGARQRASDEFRTRNGVTMFSSDVTARGMDYPDVTFVLQVGIPSSVEQYIHRLGRTARAGKKGRGSLVLCDFEAFFLRGLSQLPVKDSSAKLPQQDNALADLLYDGLRRVPYTTKAMAYAAWLGYYNSAKVAWSKTELVRQANYFATDCLFLESPPELQRKTVGKMGLTGTPGLVLEPKQSQQQQQPRQGNFSTGGPQAQPQRGAQRGGRR